MVVALESLPSLNAEQLRTLAAELIDRVTQQSQAIAERDSDILYRHAKIDKLTHELATLKRWKFGRSSELLNAGQISLLDETIEAYIAAIEQELKALTPAAKTDTQPRQQPKRAALPAGLPRVDIHHEPDSTTCGCGCQLKRIGQDVAERLDYTPGVFTVEQHIRGKWACAQCETLIQAPIQAQIIDKGISELYDVEREIKHLLPDERLRERQKQSKPLADAFHQWMLLQRQKITDGSATAKALDYSLKRWGALTQFLDDGQLPIDNNWIENQIRPIAIGRSNWLLAGTLRAGQRAAAVMSLIQSALCRVRHRALYADHRTMPNGFASFWILHSWRVTGSA